MRRFIITTFLVFASTLLILGLLVQHQGPKYFNLWSIALTEKHDIASGKIAIDPPEILALGNSQMFGGFIPDMFPGSYNLAIPGTTIVEQYYLLRKYLQNNQAPKTVVLGLFPQNEYYYHYTYWNLHVRYGAYSFSEIWEVLKNAIATNNFLMFKEQNGVVQDSFDYTVKALSNKLNFPNESQEVLRKIVTLTPPGPHIQRIKEFHSRQKGFFNFNADNRVDYLLQYLLEGKRIERNDTFTLEPLFFHYLNEFMELINQHGISLVAVTMPRATTLTNKIGVTTIQESDVFFKDFFSRHPNTVYISDVFNLADSDFLDSHHFSYGGALKFTTLFKEIMTTKGLLNSLSQTEQNE